VRKLVFLKSVARDLKWIFDDSAPREAGAFCLVRTATGARATRYLVTEIVAPTDEPWEFQQEALLRPSARYISAAISRAVSAKAGLLFIHSHPNAAYPPGMSSTDQSAFRALASTLGSTVDGPFCAAIAHPMAWKGYVWADDTITEMDSVWSSGRWLDLLGGGEPEPLREWDDREQRALGPANAIVRGLSVAVVGCGGLGSPIAEVLSRMGVATVILIDPDVLDTPSNVRREFGARRTDLSDTSPPPKVDIVGRHIEQIGLGTRVIRICGDATRAEVLREVLDADAVICGTDNHGSRAAVNQLPSAALLPVIDVGVRAGQKTDGSLCGLVSETRRVLAGEPCLWCQGALDADQIRAENLPAAEREALEREGYLVGGTAPEPSTVALTVLGAGQATCALATLLGPEGDVAPVSYWFDGVLGDSRHVLDLVANPDCRCQTALGQGDAGIIAA
jgi:hypothetical protein